MLHAVSNSLVWALPYAGSEQLPSRVSEMLLLMLHCLTLTKLEELKGMLIPGFTMH